jgi:hypothetical protein
MLYLVLGLILYLNYDHALPSFGIIGTTRVVPKVKTISYPTEQSAVLEESMTCGILHCRLSSLPLRDTIVL